MYGWCKIECTSNGDVVRGCLCENYSTQKFIARNILTLNVCNLHNLQLQCMILYDTV